VRRARGDATHTTSCNQIALVASANSPTHTTTLVTKTTSHIFGGESARAARLTAGQGNSLCTPAVGMTQ